MSMISFRHKGDFSKTQSYLKKVRTASEKDIFDKYGRMGVEALMAATPVDTGRTAASWSYTVEKSQGRKTLVFHNSNFQNGLQIAILIQYGHGTRNGGYVQGRDYINPALQPVFDKMAQELWREVTTV